MLYTEPGSDWVEKHVESDIVTKRDKVTERESDRIERQFAYLDEHCH